MPGPRRPNPRQCAATNRYGDPCKAMPMRNSDWCASHNTEIPEDARFGAKAQSAAAGHFGGTASRRPRLTEVMHEEVERHVKEILAPYFEALTGAVMSSTYEGEVIVSEHPDLEARQRAAERLLDRVYGRPKQATEISGPGGEAPAVELVLDGELQHSARELLRRASREE